MSKSQLRLQVGRDARQLEEMMVGESGRGVQRSFDRAGNGPTGAALGPLRVPANSSSYTVVARAFVLDAVVKVLS